VLERQHGISNQGQSSETQLNTFACFQLPAEQSAIRGQRFTEKYGTIIAIVAAQTEQYRNGFKA
jgi:hypothetical protein